MRAQRSGRGVHEEHASRRRTGHRTSCCDKGRLPRRPLQRALPDKPPGVPWRVAPVSSVPHQHHEYQQDSSKSAARHTQSMPVGHRGGASWPVRHDCSGSGARSAAAPRGTPPTQTATRDRGRPRPRRAPAASPARRRPATALTIDLDAADAPWPRQRRRTMPLRPGSSGDRGRVGGHPAGRHRARARGPPGAGGAGPARPDQRRRVAVRAPAVEPVRRPARTRTARRRRS